VAVGIGYTNRAILTVVGTTDALSSGVDVLMESRPLVRAVVAFADGREKERAAAPDEQTEITSRAETGQKGTRYPEA